MVSLYGDDFAYGHDGEDENDICDGNGVGYFVGDDGDRGDGDASPVAYMYHGNICCAIVMILLTVMVKMITTVMMVMVMVMVMA